MTLSEFQRAVADEFGDGQGRALLRDLVMRSLGDRTPQQALDSGQPPAAVWRALCEEMDVPQPRRYGVGIAEPPANS